MEEIEEILDDKGLDNAYRFSRCHLIKPKVEREEYEEEDEADQLPYGMHIIYPFGVIEPKRYAYNTRNQPNN